MAVQVELFPGRSGIYIIQADAETEGAAHIQVAQAAASAGLVLLPYGQGTFITDRNRVFYWLAEVCLATAGAMPRPL